MTMVHVPSCAYIRRKNSLGNTVRDCPASQGLMIDVFEDKIIVHGVDFTKGVGGEFIPPSTYTIQSFTK